MKSVNNSMAFSVLLDVLDDIQIRWPDYRGMQLDKSRILRYDTSSFWLLVKDLAAMDSCLISSFRDGSLPLERPYHLGRKSHGDHRPTFLWFLWAKVFEASGVLMSSQDIDYSAVRYLRQVFTCFKKLTKEFTDEQLEDSVASFESTDQRIPEYQSSTFLEARTHDSGVDLLDHSLEKRDQSRSLDRDDFNALKLCFSCTISSLGQFDPWSIRPRHGPGAVSDARRGSYKYDFPAWHNRLESIFPQDWHGSHDLMPRLSRDFDGPSKLIAVPKDYKGPRLIAAEPTCNQWIQQGILSWMEERIKRSFLIRSITLRDQTRSQILARKGSTDPYGYATIDLSEASDRISYQLAADLFAVNPQLWEAISVSRTQYIRLRRKEHMRLHKFSTMGSALTFPVQCFLFASIAYAAILRSRNLSPSFALIKRISKEVVIYGDDIIVPTDAALKLVHLLEALGLKVNMQKSFWTGRFRESCGADFLDGVDITPVKIKMLPDATNPESLISWVSTCNNVHERISSTLAEKLAANLPPDHFRMIRRVKPGSGDFGIFSINYYECNVDIPIRYNTKLHRSEQLCYVPQQRGKRCDTDSTGPLLQYFTERPNPNSHWESGPRIRPTLSLKRRWVALSN